LLHPTCTGKNEGGTPWDYIFANSGRAQLFAANAARLVKAASAALGNKAFVGIDLDIEDTTSKLPYFNDFMKTFRALVSLERVAVVLSNFEWPHL
jgi:hypothetical protein